MTSLNNAALSQHRSPQVDLIHKGIALASLPGNTVTLAAACAHSGISPEIAQEFFADDAAYLDALKGELIQLFHAQVSFPNTTDLETGLRELFFAYVSFARTAPSYFSAMSSLFVASSDFMETDSLDLHPMIRYTRELVKQAAPTASPWLQTTRTLALFSSIHGSAHLCAIGILRHLREGARNRSLNAAITHVIAGINDSLTTECGLTMAPKAYAGAAEFPVVPPALFFPKNTPEESAMALFRGAVEDVLAVGVDNISIESAATRAELPLNVARGLLHADIPFVKQLENHLDALSTQVLKAQMAAVPEGEPLICYGKASALGYIGCAMMDPVGFEVYIEVSSGSIVPNSFEKSDGSFEMGDAFALLVDLVRECIVQGGGPKNTLVLYESTLSLWSYSHGIAHSFSCGPFRNLPWQEKFSYISPLVDISIGSLVHRLQLDIPGVEMAPVLGPTGR
ncbi:hypothetical protein QVA66_08765 [Staphylococcus chromogenes]|nr:hypothetical protein [Staphylococcus chromogenes]